MGASTQAFTTAALGTGTVAALGIAALQLMPAMFTSDTLVALLVQQVAPFLCGAAFLVSLVCVTDGILIAYGDLKMQCLQQAANIPLLYIALSCAKGQGLALPAVWLGMCVLQTLRLCQNIVRLVQVRRERVQAACTRDVSGFTLRVANA